MHDTPPPLVPAAETLPGTRVRLSFLWCAATFCYLYGDYFELYTPGKVDSLLDGSNVLDGPTQLLVAAVILSLPPLVVVVTLLMPALVARWANLVVAAFFTVMMVLIGLGSLTAWYAFYVYLAAVETVITALILREAYRWRVPRAGGDGDG